jgi:hypothetical protein
MEAAVCLDVVAVVSNAPLGEGQQGPHSDLRRGSGRGGNRSLETPVLLLGTGRVSSLNDQLAAPPGEKSRRGGWGGRWRAYDSSESLAGEVGGPIPRAVWS